MTLAAEAGGLAALPKHSHGGDVPSPMEMGWCGSLMHSSWQLGKTENSDRDWDPKDATESARKGCGPTEWWPSMCSLPLAWRPDMAVAGNRLCCILLACGNLPTPLYPVPEREDSPAGHMSTWGSLLRLWPLHRCMSVPTLPLKTYVEEGFLPPSVCLPPPHCPVQVYSHSVLNVGGQHTGPAEAR